MIKNERIALLIQISKESLFNPLKSFLETQTKQILNIHYQKNTKNLSYLYIITFIV